MREREFLTIDTGRVASEANALAARIQSALEARNTGAPAVKQE
jgi:hypothetical protein